MHFCFILNVTFLLQGCASWQLSSYLVNVYGARIILMLTEFAPSLIHLTSNE